MTYAPAKSEVATYNGLEDIIIRNVMQGWTDRLWYEINIPYFSKEKVGIIIQLNEKMFKKNIISLIKIFSQLKNVS